MKRACIGPTIADGGTSDLSVITVAYRSEGYIADGIRSALESAAAASLAAEVIVVDNCSPDASAEAVRAVAPAAMILTNDRNVGFGRANNRAFAVAQGRAWLLLNPDARMDPGSIPALVAHLEAHPRAGAVAPSIAPVDGTAGAESAGMLPGLRSAVGHFLFVNRLLPGTRGGPWRGFQVRARPGAPPSVVEWASAAALLVRPEAVRAVGGFDPSIFMYGEDVDLGRRLMLAGWETWLVPCARATHAISAVAGGVQTTWVDAISREYGRGAGRLRMATFNLILATGLAIRAVASRRRGTDPIQSRRMTASAQRALKLVVDGVRRRRPGDRV